MLAKVILSSSCSSVRTPFGMRMLLTFVPFVLESVMYS